MLDKLWVCRSLSIDASLKLLDFVKMQTVEVFSADITLVDVHLHWLNLSHFFILVEGPVILIGCMIFLSTFLEVIRMSTSTASFLAQLGSGILCLQNCFLWPMTKMALSLELIVIFYLQVLSKQLSHMLFIFLRVQRVPWLFPKFLLFSSTFSLSSNEKYTCFSLIIGRNFDAKLSLYELFQSKFLSVKQSLYQQLQCYMTTIFKNYDNNIWFNSFFLFLWKKYQHKSYHDQIMNHTIL